MTKARTLADFISDGSPLADGTISVSEVSGAAPLANPTFTGTASGTFSGPLTGAVTGNVTGDLTGNVTGAVTGNVTGDLTGNVTAPFVSLVGILPTLDFATMLLQVAVSQATDPVAVGTWFDSTASDGYKYGDLDKSGSIGAQDGSLMNQLSAGLASEAVTSRWYNIIVPSLVTQSWYADLVTDGTILAGGTLDITNGWTIEQEAGNFHVSKDNVTKLDIASDGALTTNSIDLSAIAATIADTAVDIFVYDTRKDSDGGAWRKRTKGTSWYNETLNTATRGSRKEFPAVAVIVAEQEQITIYDGDDPDLPMWMVFNTNSGWSMLYYGTGVLDVSAVAMLNGKLCVTSNNNPSTYAAGVTDIDFVKDRGAIWYKTGSSGGYGYYDEPISGRNVAALGLISISSATVVHYNLNDVAMTVLPNAPIDAATGLPVPTIAVATNGGVSVIKDDGTVHDYTSTHGGTAASDYVTFDPVTHAIYFTTDYGGSGDAYKINAKPIPTADAALGVSTYTSFQNFDGDIQSGGNITVPHLINGGSVSDATDINALQSTGEAQLAIAEGVGLNQLYEDRAGLTDSMIAYTASDYATGWMNGNIKLATLSDTDDTNVTGAELVTGDNSTFTSGIGDWFDPFYGTTPTNSGGYLTFDSTGSYMQARLAIASALTVGETYTLSFDNIAGIGVNFYATVEGTTITVTTAGVYTLTFVASSTTLQIDFKRAATSGTAQLDNVSVRLAEEDRSVNGNGLQVFGTVTKNPVASGADLVAYSNATTSDYLYQPYNADLDFAGDFSVVFWGRSNPVAQHTYFARQNPSTGSNSYGSTPYLFAQSNPSNTMQWYYRGTSTSGAYVGNAVVRDGLWHHFCLMRSGSTMYAYIDGKLDGSFTFSESFANTSAPLYIGVHSYNNSFLRPMSSGGVSLFRISATAPSPEQIAKIYEDEKHLFQTGAQATLYGSSDAVTALAYDDTTELLHVGTSAGRSVFQGLRRVDNTTTAVGAAISASNGLVADE